MSKMKGVSGQEGRMWVLINQILIQAQRKAHINVVILLPYLSNLAQDFRLRGGSEVVAKLVKTSGESRAF